MVVLSIYVIISHSNFFYQFRTQISILHHNENCQRPILLGRDGLPRRQVKRCKTTKLVPTVQYSRTKPTYSKCIEPMVIAILVVTHQQQLLVSYFVLFSHLYGRSPVLIPVTKQVPTSAHTPAPSCAIAAYISLAAPASVLTWLQE